MMRKIYACRRWMNRVKTHVSTPQIIAVAFALIILTGTLLLMLPISSRSGVGSRFSSGAVYGNFGHLRNGTGVV